MELNKIRHTSTTVDMLKLWWKNSNCYHLAGLEGVVYSTKKPNLEKILNMTTARIKVHLSGKRTASYLS